MSLDSMLKVTVVIPAYNEGDYIQQSIESALNQGNLNLEVIVCDDFSTDNTVAVVEAMINKDCRIKLIKNQENKGPSYSRNHAISEASGEWIALLDADDFYHPERLETLVNIAESQNADLMADNIFYVDKCGKNPVAAMPSPAPDNILATLTAAEFIANDLPIKAGFNYGYLKPIIRHSFLRDKQVRYDQEIRIGEDYLLYVECLLKNAIFLLLNQPYYYYRIYKTPKLSGDDRVTTELLNGNLKLINIAGLTGNLAVAKLLEKRQQNLEQTIFYINLVRLVRSRQFYSAIKKLLANPNVWLTCLTLGGRYVKKLFKCGMKKI